MRLDIPEHLTPACDLGITIPVALEELWPPDVWIHADQQGWLVRRSKKGLIGERLLERLTEEDERLSDLIDDDWRLYFEKRVQDEPGSTAKMDWANYIIALPPAQLETISGAVLETIDEALEGLDL